MNIEYKKAILDENTVKQLIDLSYVWEKEDITFGLRHNEPSDIGEICFIALDNDKIIGYIFGNYFINDKYRSYGEIGDKFFDVFEIYVLPEYRSQGIGKKLFSLLEEEVRKEAKYIILSTATKDYKRILKFYSEEVEMTFHDALFFKKTNN